MIVLLFILSNCGERRHIFYERQPNINAQAYVCLEHEHFSAAQIQWKLDRGQYIRISESIFVSLVYKKNGKF